MLELNVEAIKDFKKELEINLNKKLKLGRNPVIKL